ncbi:hypothetical protein BD289DRAFT_430871 [Coniella lustricola]|uniref:Uncharacterized protein n=1 Tax=Coniella lustricola TaxID=2025994 RepID=A0A2T3ABE8_9PEZI|nr:hypothetical protein BD289DRAFT_430871 [Coniella lustricola]
MTRHAVVEARFCQSLVPIPIVFLASYSIRWPSKPGIPVNAFANKDFKLCLTRSCHACALFVSWTVTLTAIAKTRYSCQAPAVTQITEQADFECGMLLSCPDLDSDLTSNRW